MKLGIFGWAATNIVVRCKKSGAFFIETDESFDAQDRENPDFEQVVNLFQVGERQVATNERGLPIKAEAFDLVFRAEPQRKDGFGNAVLRFFA